jgi:hypothetical protein
VLVRQVLLRQTDRHSDDQRPSRAHPRVAHAERGEPFRSPRPWAGACQFRPHLTRREGVRKLSNKQIGWLFAAVGALLLCNGDVRCTIKRLFT